ncbi:MAG: ABC transporter permease [Candidatus Bipolaricaulota bacterium]|nr:ABC transporter permease [Candidatus Bipolaricaulota bacterium]MDW8126695.1 ABC transporter permease [Candidatus Bipolaricaulota bacterium]
MGWANWLISTVSRALAFGVPLLWGTLGEIYAERSGVVNLGVEGMMILGAFMAFAITQQTGHPGLGLVCAALIGGLAALLHAFVTITLRANQYVSGLALSMFGLGLAGLLGRGWEGKPLGKPLPTLAIPGLSQIPVLGPMLFQDQTILTYLGIVFAVILWALLFHTRWGIAIRSVGENPATADSLGINVTRVRYLCVVFGGLLAGVGGGYLSVAYRPSWTEGMSAGMGWIVIALTIFASWDPVQAIWGAFFFGVLYHLSYRLQAFLAPELLKLMPYLFAIVVLAVSGFGRARWRQRAPGALGLPYVRGER